MKLEFLPTVAHFNVIHKSSVLNDDWLRMNIFRRQSQNDVWLNIKDYIPSYSDVYASILLIMEYVCMSSMVANSLCSILKRKNSLQNHLQLVIGCIWNLPLTPSHFSLRIDIDLAWVHSLTSWILLSDTLPSCFKMCHSINTDSRGGREILFLQLI